MEGFKLIKAGMSVLQALTQPIEHLFPYPAVSKESGDATERDSQVDEVMKMAVEGSRVSCLGGVTCVNMEPVEGQGSFWDHQTPGWNHL